MFYYTQDEIQRLFGAADAHSPIHGLLLRTCYRHAFRISEALSLTTANLKNGRLVVRRSKGGKITHQKASPELLAYAVTVPTGALLFPISNGTPSSARRAANRLLRRLCQQVGIDATKAHTHALRHSCVHHSRAAGVSYPVLTVHLGHADPKSILHYDIATEQEAETAMAAVVGV